MDVDYQDMNREDLMRMIEEREIEIHDVGYVSKARAVEILQEDDAADEGGEEEAAEPTEPAEAQADDSELAQLRQQMEALQRALRVEQQRAAIATRAAEDSTQDEMVEVESCKITTVSLVFTDSRGEKVHKRLTNKNPRAIITRTQLEELRMKAPAIFDRGLVRIVGDPLRANDIPDVDVWLKEHSQDQLHDAVQGIDSTATLNKLWGWIEDKRMKRVMDQERGVPVLKPQNLKPKVQILRNEVKARIEDMTGISLTEE